MGLGILIYGGGILVTAIPNHHCQCGRSQAFISTKCLGVLQSLGADKNGHLTKVYGLEASGARIFPHQRRMREASYGPNSPTPVMLE